jgi:putative MATE family efflux protein
MHDLTTGPVTRHLLKTTSFMLVTMVTQTLYVLVDLYWVGSLGKESVAAVGVAGNLTFIVLGLSQMLGVGTTTLISHSVGRRDPEGARLAFNQSQVLSVVSGTGFVVFALLARRWYTRALSADAATAALADAYLVWFIPAMALQFAIVALGAALRGIGNFRPGMIVSTSTLAINIVIAPILIFGWGTGHAFGVAGAAIATLIAIAIGVVWFIAIFVYSDSPLRFDVSQWMPRLAIWKQVLSVGLPPGVEFGLIAVYLFVVYTVSRPFGAEAQAGFGIGMRIIQAGFMPVVALGFAVAPVAGQNVGAGLADRVRETYRSAAAMAMGVMLVVAILCQVAGRQLVGAFSGDPGVIAVGDEYLHIMAWTFVASGWIFVASSMFQALGNTVPSLLASVVRILVVTLPAFALARRPGFALQWIWYLSAAAILIQLVMIVTLLRREFRRRFGPTP